MGEVPKSREHILVVIPIPENKAIIDALRKKHNVDITCISQTYVHGDPLKPTEVPDDLWKSATMLVTFSSFPPVALASNLKLIHLLSAGTDAIAKSPIWKETSIPITNSSGVHGPPISEWVVMQILTVAHKDRLMEKWQREHMWGNNIALLEGGGMRDSVGMRLGVLGYGSIGRQTARICKALGMDVIAYTASPRSTPESRKDKGKYTVPSTGDPDGSIPSAWYSGLDKASLHNFLSQDIDILLISVPLTPETHHFLAAPEFEILGSRRNAFVINIARGLVVNQDDLITYLKKPQKEGGLRGAALDVTTPEPLPKESELWDLENVKVTPHASSISNAYLERSFAILDINLGNLEKGEEFINVVNRRKGY